VTDSGPLPWAARLLVVAVALGGGIVVLGWLLDVGSWSTGDVAACVAIALATAVAERFPLELLYRNARAVYSLAAAIWTGSLLLVEPSVLALAVAAGVLAGQALHRRPAIKIAFNVGQFTLAIGGALAVFEALGSPPGDEPASWLAAAAAMTAFQAINTLLVGLIIALVEARPLREVLLVDTAIVQLIGNLAIGIVGALVWLAQPLAMPLLLVPLAATYIAYGEWLRALQERDEMVQMAHAAEAIATSADVSRRIAMNGGIGATEQLAARFNRMLAALESSMLRERAFIREGAQELRSPLTVCRRHVQALDAEPNADELLEIVAFALDELDRMTRIADEMSQLAYMEDPTSLHRRTVDCQQLLSDVARKAAPLLSGRLGVPPASPAGALRADSDRLVLALTKLVENAHHHTAPGTPIELRATSDNGVCRFDVVDAGGGVSPGDEERVFEPFYKRRDSSGSGLGLAIAEAIARAHGGEAGVDNRPGEGATFWLRIPR
jgi:signal transduction histidine kinase